jgi:DNA polymerase III subunit delta'
MTLYGLDPQIAAFRAALAGDRMHHAWLLAGPRGVGKASFADWAAHVLLDADADGSSGARLLAAGSHPDFIRLERLTDDKGKTARSIKVEQVQALRAILTKSTSQGSRRVIIIDSAEDLEGRHGPNAILKMLEEPPAGTIFLLVSHQPGRLLPTIRSRCRTLMFGALDDAAMTSILGERLPEVDPAKRAFLISGANGSPATALAYADLDMATLDAALVELAQSGDPTNAVRSKLAQSLSLKAALPRYEAFLDRAPVFIADQARRAEGPELEAALTAWGKARALSQIAVSQSLIPETVVFELAGHVASLAPQG